MHASDSGAKESRSSRFRVATRAGRELQGFLDSPLDTLYQGIRTAAETVHPVGRGDAVTHLVADQRLGPAEQHGDEDLFAGDPRGHGLVISVHHLGDDQVLEQMQARMELAFGGDTCCLGGGVDVKGLLPPCLVDAASGLTGQDL